VNAWIAGLIVLGACAGPAESPGGAEGTVRAAPTPVAPVQSGLPAPPEVSFRLPTREARSPAALGETPELMAARATLEKIVRTFALDPENPWAVAHGMLVFGSDIDLSNGRPAVEFLFAEYAAPVPMGGAVLLAFPPKREVAGRPDIRIEPHADLLLKALLEGGVAPDRAVQVDGRTFRVADLYRESLYRTWVQGDRLSVASWNDVPWTLQGLATWAPDDLAWTAEGGRPMTLDGLTTAVVGQLHEETRFLREAMEKGEAVEKRKQGIFAYTCGGAHLLQGAAYAVARGFGTEADRRSIEAEVPVMFFRRTLELRQIDRALETNPEYRTLLLEQRMKFLGHWLETMHKLAALGLYTPDPSQQAAMKEAGAELAATIGELEERGILDRVGELKGPNEQLYLDFVGDSAHAIRGIDLATGAGTIAF
jgi:hypothetical protein